MLNEKDNDRSRKFAGEGFDNFLIYRRDCGVLETWPNVSEFSCRVRSDSGLTSRDSEKNFELLLPFASVMSIYKIADQRIQ